MGDEMEEEVCKEEDLGMNSDGDAEPEADIGGAGDSGLAPENDPYSPSDLLVDDTWFHVLRYLDNDPRDLINFAQTCSYFKELVETPRPDGFGAGHEACRLEEVFPLIFKWLDKEDILASRRVCHRVGDKVDKILQRGTLITTHRNLGIFPRLIPPFPLASERRGSFEWTHVKSEFHWPEVELTSAERIANFQNYMETQRFIRTGRRVGPRIVSGTVSLEESGEPTENFESQAKFLQRSLEFLRASRLDKILSVKICVVDKTPLTSLYELFRNLCLVAPHLQSLEILPTYWEVDPPSSQESEQQLNDLIHGHQLPPVPNLDRIRINIRITRPFVHHLAEAFGAQLRILDLEMVDPALFLQRPVQVPEYHFPVLEEMRTFTSSLCFPFLLSIKAPSLKALEFSHSSELDDEEAGERETSPLVELVEAVNNFPSLVSLRLYIFWPILDGNDDDFVRDLNWVVAHQALKNLVISTCNLLPTLRFFLNWLPNVEFISIVEEITELAEERNDQDLTLLEGGRLQESTIWRETPTLEQVKMKVYARPFIYDDPNSSWYSICKRPAGT